MPSRFYSFISEICNPFQNLFQELMTGRTEKSLATDKMFSLCMYFMCRLWDDEVFGLDCGEECAQWLVEVLGRKCRLLYNASLPVTRSSDIPEAHKFPLLRHDDEVSARVIYCIMYKNYCIQVAYILGYRKSLLSVQYNRFCTRTGFHFNTYFSIHRAYLSSLMHYYTIF